VNTWRFGDSRGGECYCNTPHKTKQTQPRIVRYLRAVHLCFDLLNACLSISTHIFKTLPFPLPASLPRFRHVRISRQYVILSIEGDVHESTEWAWWIRGGHGNECQGVLVVWRSNALMHAYRDGIMVLSKVTRHAHWNGDDLYHATRNDGKWRKRHIMQLVTESTRAHTHTRTHWT
jgi:hypothetical protein